MEEALAIAARHGIVLDPDQYAVAIDTKGNQGAYATYFVRVIGQKSVIDFERITVPSRSADPDDRSDLSQRRWRVLIPQSTLQSDEAIVAALAHELYESQRMREEFERNRFCLPETRVAELVGPGSRSYHTAAWEYADRIIDRIRASGQPP